MDNKLVICIVIFALTLLSYIINKIPMWVTALLSLAALYITGCVDANGALGGFANVNTILMGACFMVASGFRRTSLVKIMCDWLLKLTNGSFMKVYFGYLLLGVLLTNFMGSPMVVYAIIGPLLCALCDRTGNSRSKYIFPLMVIVVACCFALPLPTSIQKAGEFNGYLETYQFTGLEFAPLDFFFARFPVIILCLVWAMTIGPKMCPSKAAVELAAAEEQKDISSKLSPMVDKIGMVIFVVTMIGLIFSTQLHIASWWIALAGSILMAMFGVVDQKKALAEIPWEMLILYAGALALGNGLVNTGAGTSLLSLHRKNNAAATTTSDTQNDGTTDLSAWNQNAPYRNPINTSSDAAMDPIVAYPRYFPRNVPVFPLSARSIAIASRTGMTI